MSIELYINNELCDLDSSNLSIVLKRQFVKPTELNSKDGQKSYSITLPATPNNNDIFSYANVEEIRHKFKIYDKAKLYVNGVLILDGKFILAEIRRDRYIGNLGVLAPIAIKDIFGERTLNNAGSWILENFKGVESMSEYNTDNYDKEKYGNIAPCIFPLVLYRLLPKQPDNNGEFTSKDVFDKQVRLDLDDMPPSVNCIKMLERIFDSAKYKLTGSAMTNERLKKLYVSYKNPNDYELDWGVGRTSISGIWRHYRKNGNRLETNYKRNSDKEQYYVNLFDSEITQFTKREGTSIKNDKGKTTIIVPATGLYKVHLHTTLVMSGDSIAGDIGSTMMGAREGTFIDAPIEIHLVKNLDRDLTDLNFNNNFYRDNINQDVNQKGALFPQNNCVNFIDPKQDSNFICGFNFGRSWKEEYKNPLSSNFCNPMAISGGRSWDIEVDSRAFSAVNSPMYKTKEGLISDKYVVDLRNANTGTSNDGDTRGFGDIYQVIWLEKGDRLDLIDMTNYRWSMYGFYIYNHNVNFTLDIEPFRQNKNWITVGNNGSTIDNNGVSAAPMDWNDPATFKENEIDLIKFLPSEIKINDWIDNFCKAFNLILSNTGTNSFSLDIKDKGTVRRTSKIIDLDSKANVRHSYNQPLNIPYVYELGFTVDESEEGYYYTMEDEMQEGKPTGNKVLNTGNTGGGTFYTNSQSTSKVTQTSSFSYCWYKELFDSDKPDRKLVANVPVISDHEVWEYDYDYKEMVDKTYFDKAQRFWFKEGTIDIEVQPDIFAKLALVSNESDKLTLDYKDKDKSIMRSFFLLLTNERNYTVVECYLSAEEYSNLNRSLIRFNGDLYNVAEIDKYDATNRNKGELKLISRIR